MVIAAAIRIACRVILRNYFLGYLLINDIHFFPLLKGNKCKFTGSFFSQCVEDATSYLPQSSGCIANYGAVCDPQSTCCDPGQTIFSCTQQWNLNLVYNLTEKVRPAGSWTTLLWRVVLPLRPLPVSNQLLSWPWYPLLLSATRNKFADSEDTV